MFRASSWNDRTHGVKASGRGAVRKAVTALGSRLDQRVRTVRTVLTKGLTVIVFHDVCDHPSEFGRTVAGSITPELFGEQVSWLTNRFCFVKPTELAQLGGQTTMPENAALLTFDDAWAGVFQVALPILAAQGIPALCFLNMATVEGDPDLAAVRSFEKLQGTADGGPLDRRIDHASAAAAIAYARAHYREDSAFRTYQGKTATYDDLWSAAQSKEQVWFGSHLYHHWDIRFITSQVYEESLRANWDALSPLPNALPVLATPHGYNGGEDGHTIPVARRVGIRALFTGTGGQNRSANSYVLDRLALPPDSWNRRDWWYATHRGRLFGHAVTG